LVYIGCLQTGGKYEDIQQVAGGVMMATVMNGSAMKSAFENYIKDIKEKNFPKDEHSFH